MKYLIKFSLFGKNMQTTIEADTKDQAEYKLRGKIKIVTIERMSVKPLKSRKTDTPDVVNDIMDMFK